MLWRPSYALVRRPSPRLAEGEVTQQARVPVDVARALAQHADYTALLEAHGLKLRVLPELADHPDGVFVEDVVVKVDSAVVLTRPGAASRRGEVASVAAFLRAHGHCPLEIHEPATLDGGDVLVLPHHLLVGRSARTNQAALSQLARVAERSRRTLVAVAIAGVLHLKSAVTALPDGSLIAAPAHVDTASLEAFGYRVLVAPEASAGDVLCLGATVVLPSDAPATAALLQARGFRTAQIDISEFQKLDGGVTCLSVLL